MQRKIIQTADGSSSLYVPELNEHYHSTHGAIQESMHVFINTGFKQISQSNIKIFEMGYGTGLNFLLSYIHAQNKKLEYHCIEAYPLEKELVEQLNYTSELNLKEEDLLAFQAFHRIESTVVLNDHFSVIKSNCILKDYMPPTLFDLIYFDAFSPDIQPELWSVEVFQKMFGMLNPGGILTTYCAKGIVRRAMQSSGFVVERLPGPPGKREILRATKPV
jgi:tRNA U34 5-methylaminomethyl-2-thiouridine-forming methyltransferase MnmC